MGQIGVHYIATWRSSVELHTYSYLVSKGDTITLRYNTGFDANYFYTYKPSSEDIERLGLQNTYQGNTFLATIIAYPYH